MAESQNAARSGWDEIEDTELVNVEDVTAAKIVRELTLTPPDLIEYREDKDAFKVELTLSGGFTAFQFPSSKYAIKSVLGAPDDNGREITIWVVEKRV